MSNFNRELRYSDIIKSFNNNPRDVSSHTLGSIKQIWFYTYVDKGKLTVNCADAHEPSSKMTRKRCLSESEFSKLYEIYNKRENGEHIASSAKKYSKNATYWFGIFKDVADKRNLLSRKKTDLKLRKHIIVYIDILGYKKMIEDFRTEQMFLKYIHEALRSALEVTKYKNINNKVKKHIFSDNCVFAIDIEECKEEEVAYKMLLLFQFTSLFQHFLAAQRMIYIRGGMTIGNLYMNNEIGYVTGSGLVKAYNIENEHAKYPRIVVSNEIYDFAKDKDELKSYMVVDLDDKVYLGYLTYLTNKLVDLEWDDTFSPIILNMLVLHKESILQAIKVYGNDEKVYQKYQWVARYHNIWCKLTKLDKFSISSTGEERFLIPSSITDISVQGKLFG